MGGRGGGRFQHHLVSDQFHLQSIFSNTSIYDFKHEPKGINKAVEMNVCVTG